MSGTSYRDRLVLCAFLLILVVFGALVARKYYSATAPPPLPSDAPREPGQMREVLLYFGAPDGRRLVTEARQIEGCLDEGECLRETVQALVDGPVGELLPVFPSHAVVLGVTVEGGTASVDFSRDLADAHPGGSLSELLTVVGLANTLAANFPHIRQVRILLEGAPVETLKGHVDLRQPVPADFAFGLTPPAAAGGRAGAGGARGAQKEKP
jgi:hypothetical protein